MRADADGFEDVTRKSKPRVAIADIDEFLDAIGRRPGTIEATLIGPDNVVRASSIESLDGTRDSDPRINAALRLGHSYAGHEAEPLLDRSNFEFVTPVNLWSARYALEMSYDSDSFYAQLAGVQQVLLLVGLLALVGVTGLFYLISARFAMSRVSRLSPRSREHLRAGATGRDALRGTRKPSACRLSVGQGPSRSWSRSRFRLRTGPCRALGADTPREAELRGDLACSRLASERKYVKRIYARDTGKARRQFAR